MQYHWIRVSIGSATIASLAMIACAEDEPDRSLGAKTQELTVRAECVDESGPPEGGWLCDEERVVECRERDAPDAEEVLFVDPEATCDSADLEFDPGPYGVGSHEITVLAATSDGGDPDGGAPAALCTATLTVVDTLP